MRQLGVVVLLGLLMHLAHGQTLEELSAMANNDPSIATKGLSAGGVASVGAASQTRQKDESAINGQSELKQTDLASLPHVDDCSLCFKCHVDENQPKKVISMADLVPENFQPAKVHEKQKKPSCDECRGCTHQLDLLVRSGKKHIFGRNFVAEGGASSNWLFVSQSNRTRSGRAIGKYAKLYLAIELLSEECGFMDLVPKVWIGLWMEEALGISLENVVRLGEPMMHPNQLLDIFHDTMNKTQAAIFDLMTSQCDRHAQNIFIDEDSGVMLINIECAFYEDQWCALDSILLPTTLKHTINVMENAWVIKFKNWGNKTPQCWANAALLFDYRCYVKDAKLGTDYPPEIKQCLVKIAAMEVDEVHSHYGFPSMHTADALLSRSKAMIEHGFEYALTMGYPRNPNPWRYKFPPPCCKIKHTDTYRCAHEWNPDTHLPLGNPVGGMPWTKDYPDPGSYEGGSVF
eukprot:gene20356-27121_t